MANTGARNRLSGVIGSAARCSIRLAFTLGGSAAAVAGAAGLAPGWAGGADLLAAGELASTVFGLLTAWVLLVEVRRIKG
jgi:hypothetical protein